MVWCGIMGWACGIAWYRYACMYLPTYITQTIPNLVCRVVVVSNLQMRMYVVRECGLYGLYSLYVHVTSMMYVWCTQVCKCKE